MNILILLKNYLELLELINKHNVNTTAEIERVKVAIREMEIVVEIEKAWGPIP